MAVSGKTAAPHEIPYYLGTDKPPDMAAGTKAIADQTHSRLNAIAPGQIVGGAAGKLVIAGSTGAGAYQAMKGDAILAEDGTLTIGAGAVGSSKLAAESVTNAKIANATIEDSKLKSPISGIWRTIASFPTVLLSGLNTANAYGVTNSGAVVEFTFGASGYETVASASGLITFLGTSDMFSVNGKTSKVRMKVDWSTNNVSTSLFTIVIGMRAVKAVANSTLGRIKWEKPLSGTESGSLGGRAELVNPAALTVASTQGTPETYPGGSKLYAIDIETTNAWPANLVVNASISLQARWE